MNNSMLLGVWSGINALCQLLLQFAYMAKLTTAAYSDAFFAVMAVPLLFNSVVSTSIVSVLMPTFAGESKQHQNVQQARLSLIGGALFGAMGCLLAISSNYWVSLMLPGFVGETLSASVEIAQIMSIAILFLGLNAIQTAKAQSNNLFNRIEIVQAWSAILAILIVFVVSTESGAVSLAYVFVGRLIVVVLAHEILDPGIRHSFHTPLDRKSFLKVCKKLVPLITGSLYYKSSPLVERLLLSMAQPGAISALHFAQQIYNASGQILTKAISSYPMRMLAVLHKIGDNIEFINAFALTVRRAALASLFGGTAILFFGWIILRWPIFPSLLQSHEWLILLWPVMIFSLGQFFFGNLGSIYANAYYVRSDTNRPIAIGTVAFTVGTIIKIALAMFDGLRGLCIGISFHYMLAWLLFYRDVRRGGLKEK